MIYELNNSRCNHHVFPGISCFWGSRVHQKYAEWVLVGCSSPDRNLSKNTGRHVENTRADSYNLEWEDLGWCQMQLSKIKLNRNLKTFFCCIQEGLLMYDTSWIIYLFIRFISILLLIEKIFIWRCQRGAQMEYRSPSKFISKQPK